MSAAVNGKLVVLTGTFTKMSRADAEAALTGLGAQIGKSLTRKTELLIYGDKAGSKLAQAQQYGVATQDEAWLMDVLAGGDGASAAREALSGPLHDYVARVMAWAEALRANPAVRVGLCRAPGVSADRLDRLAKSWGLDAFSPAITNFYKQTDGLFLFWADTNHPQYEEGWDPRKPYYRMHLLDQLAREPIGAMSRMPTTYEIESFPWETGGILWILPAADALKVGAGYYSFAYDVIPEDEERQAYGRTWRGESLERALRVFDASLQYYPVAFLMDPVSAEPAVIIGDDHGACWTDSRIATFEAHLEGLFKQRFTMEARRGLVVGHNPRAALAFKPGEEVPMEALLTLVAVPKAVEGGAFVLKVASLGEASAAEARALRLREAYSGRFVWLKTVLGLKLSVSDEEAFAAAMVEATADMSALDAATAGRVASALGLKSKSKKAVGEALWVTGQEGQEVARVVVVTRFDLDDYKPAGSSGRERLVSMVSGCAQQVVREVFGADNVAALREVKVSGRSVLEVELDVLLKPGHGVAAGEERASAVEPTRA